MVRDVLIYSMDKGQAPLFLAATIIIIALFKLPQSYLPTLVDRIIKKTADGYFVGYILWIASVAGWYINVKLVLKFKNKEIDRMADQRNFYQQKCIDGKIESSET